MDECNQITEKGSSCSPFPLDSCSPTAIDRIKVEQIMELETRNSQLQEELATAPSKRPSASSPDWTPRAPARYTLSGHRSPVTRVTFHPLFNIVVSASEDSSIKVYDWETGDFERTVKGHTKAVQDVDFDSKGNLLGQSLFPTSLARTREDCSCFVVM